LRNLSLPYFFATALMAGAFAGPALAQAPVGTLECNIAPNSGSIVGSSQPLNCAFHTVSGYTELYTGTMSTIGLDLGFSNGSHLSWSVVMATPRPTPYSLAGVYTGATAGLTIGGGLSGNALVGGNNGAVTLQPVSVATDSGLNISAGIGQLNLQPVLPPPPHHRKKHH